jgi:hypothetical protein
VPDGDGNVAKHADRVGRGEIVVKVSIVGGRHRISESKCDIGSEKV